MLKVEFLVLGEYVLIDFSESLVGASREEVAKRPRS